MMDENRVREICAALEEKCDIQFSINENNDKLQVKTPWGDISNNMAHFLVNNLGTIKDWVREQEQVPDW